MLAQPLIQRWLNRVYPRCFAGRTLVDWLIQRVRPAAAGEGKDNAMGECVSLETVAAAWGCAVVSPAGGVVDREQVEGTVERGCRA